MRGTSNVLVNIRAVIASKSEIEYIKTIVDSTNPRVIVALMNDTREKACLFDDVNYKLTVIIDEVDHLNNTKDIEESLEADEPKYKQYMRELINKSVNLFGITATLYDIVLRKLEEGTNGFNIFSSDELTQIPIPERYKGIVNGQIDIIPIESTLPNSIGRINDNTTHKLYWQKDANYNEIAAPKVIHDILMEKPIAYQKYKYSTGPELEDKIRYHPICLLIKATHRNDEQFHIQDKLHKLYPDLKLITCVLNTHGLTIRTNCGARSINIRGKECQIKNDKPQFNITNDSVGISDFLGYVNRKNPRNCTSVDDAYTNFKYSVVVIIAGDKADRCLSFVSDDYELHLTHQFYLANERTCASDLQQSIRICGVFNDNIKPKLYVPKCLTDLIKSTCLFHRNELVPRILQDKTGIINHNLNNNKIHSKYSKKIVTKTNVYKTIYTDTQRQSTGGKYWIVNPSREPEKYKKLIKLFEDEKESNTFATGVWYHQVDMFKKLTEFKLDNLCAYTEHTRHSKSKSQKTDDETHTGLLIKQDNSGDRVYLRYNVL
jgi:hypothetical protein